MVSQRTPFLDALGEDVELAALFSEFGRRGIDPRPALSFARSSQELKTNLKTRLALPDSRAERGAAAEALQRETPHLSEPRGPRYQQFRESTPGMTPLEGAAFLSQMALSPVSIGLGAAGGYAGGAVGRQIGHERGGEQIGEILASLPGAAVSTTPHGIGQVAARALPKSGLGAARPGIAFRQGAGQLPGGVENIVEGVAAAGGVPVRAAIAGRGLAARGGGAVVRGVGQYAEEMGKSNVGNVLLPAAPETRALARAAGDVPDALPEIHPISTASINVDPGRFQFKGGVSSETGASKKLSGIRQFDPQAAGTITLWEDKAGKLFVVNGHHRVELAKRTRVPTMYAFIMREADGITEGQARAKGAIQNMQEGQGTPVDVAKFLRESNSNIESLKTRGVPVSERHVARGVALSQLDEGLFNRVAIGTLAEDAGVVIGEGLPGDFANQRAVADLVSGAKKQLTPAELKSLIQTAKGQNISVTQADMFGTTTVQKSTLIAQAKIGAWLEDQLSGDLKVFNYVTRAGRPERLARGETVVNVTRGQEMAQQSGTMLEIFRVKAHAVGKINDIVRESAEQAMQGGDEKLIRQTALDRIREAITSGDALRAEGPSNILGSPASRPPSVAPEASAPAGRGGQVGFGIGEQPQAGSLFGMAPDDIPIASQADLVLQNELAKAEAHRLRGMGQQTIPQTPEEAAALANASGPSTLADRVENATLTQKAVPAAAESFQPAPPQSTYLPIPKTVEEADALYPRVTGTSDGRIVRKGVPNTASIRAGFNDGEFEELRGIRDIPVAEFGLTGKSYSVSETRRIAELAEQIKASGEINPLIVAVDNEGLSIVEGMHRAEALYLLKAKSFPAVVIVDTSANAGVGALKEGIDAVPLSGQPALSAPAVPSTPAGGTIFTPPASVPNVHIPTQTQGPTQLPRDLAGAKPRGPGGKATLSFDSDVDKALYIIGNPATRSKAHDAYVGWLEAQFPGTDVASAGQRVRAFVAQAGRGGSAGNIRIPDTGITPRPPTRVIEGVTYPSSENVPAGGDIITDTGMIRPPPKPPSGSAALPVEPRRPDIEFPGMERPALGQNLYGLKEIKTGMTRGNKIENAVLGPMQKFNRAGKLAFHQNTPEGAAVNRARAEAKPIIASQSTQLSQRQAVAVRKAFPDLEEDAFVPSLAGKVARVKGTPGLQDIRDFYPDYEPLLTAQQKAALDPIVKTHAEIKGLLNRLGIPIGSRASTQIGGGHYIARVSQGMLKPEDIRGVPTRGLFASQKKGFEREIKFLTMAEGRAAGVKYAGIEDALKAHYQQAGERALEKHVANYLTTAVDETNWPISVPRAGDMARGPVDLPVLAEYEFPEAIAESINKVLRNEGATVGAGSSAMEAVRILNRGYRSLRASLDNSVMGIQGLLSAYAHPIAAAKAAKLNFQSWTDKNVLARFMDNFDSGAAREGRLNSSQWVSEGTLHLGATTGEFGIEGLQKLPGFKQAGRAFGYTGDGLRLQVADALLEQEMSGYSVFGIAKIGKGRTLDEIRASGDLAKIGEIANNMTGVAKKRFGGDVGEILLFAPRFLQSRLETVGKGLISLRPGASIEQKIARRSLLKMIAIGTGLTVAINELNGEDTDFRPIVNGKKNPNFMRVRAFGRDWSLFGTWDSLLRLFIAAGHGDVEAAVRSQASGITTGVFDLLIADADFVGRSTISIENKIRWAGRQFAPFSGEQSAEGIGQIASGKPGDIASGTVAAASSFSGGKSSPVGFTDHADEIARQQYGTTWADMQAQRDAAEDKMVSAGNASSPEYNDIDARMDAIAKIVTKQFPNDLGGGVTLDAKRENLARQLYHRTYGELYVSQKASINKRILGITGQEFKFNINR